MTLRATKAFLRVFPAAILPAILFLATFGMKVPDITPGQRPAPRPRAVVEEQQKQCVVAAVKKTDLPTVVIPQPEAVPAPIVTGVPGQQARPIHLCRALKRGLPSRAPPEPYV